MNKYELIEKIGDGTYGEVFEGRNRETKEIVAIKRLKGKFKSLEEVLAKTEVKILERLNHENIVELKEVLWEKNGDASYIFEYCDCNLFEFIENHHVNQKTISESVIRDIVMQITKGIRFLHSNLYFHRDLKPENILVILNNYDFNNKAFSKFIAFFYYIPLIFRKLFIFKNLFAIPIFFYILLIIGNITLVNIVLVIVVGSE